MPRPSSACRAPRTPSYDARAMTPPIWLGGLALVAGLALVVWGAERFTDGAIRLAARLALSTFFVGAVVSGLEPENLASGAAGALGLALLIAPMDVRIPREGPLAMVL